MFCVSLTKRMTSSDFLFASLDGMAKSFRNEVYSERKEFAPTGANILSFKS